MAMRPRSEAGARPAGRPRLLPALAAGLALLLLACTGSSEEPAATATPGAAPGLTTATPPPATPTPSAEEAAEAAFEDWSRTVCAVTGAFTLEFLASGDDRNPAELEFEERKERAAAMFPVQYDAVRTAARALEVMDPPLRAAELHGLLLETYRDLDAALREQEAIIAEATTTQEIADSNLPVDELISLALRQASLLVDGGYCE